MCIKLAKKSDKNGSAAAMQIYFSYEYYGIYDDDDDDDDDDNNNNLLIIQINNNNNNNERMS